MEQLNHLAKLAETSVNEFSKKLVEHPESVGQTYFEHMANATEYGVKSCVAGGVFFAHAVCPFLFEHTGSEMVNNLNNQLQNKLNKTEDDSSDDIHGENHDDDNDYDDKTKED